ncbi:acyl CoA:acetate/3-ketoacid CoA transferase subunit alpha [Bacillus safensis]|uniref:Acyl CoA:acetate/3-ketoacid CoA transferase subunit alpha n=1 Tax=Bacillus safensis TaxID=561879 RepID=A0A5S9M490_BACIA|nr:acyl CoA:acetate/3-ketoacid CoA transferase subunit alpha [Bacillus safensis]
MMNKTANFDQVITHFRDGMTIMFGGFGGVGSPPSLIDAILEANIKDLTLIGNDAGFPQIGVGRLITEGRVKKIIASHIGLKSNCRAENAGRYTRRFFYPQGILAEKIRAGGMGLAGIVTDVGMDSLNLDEKQLVQLDGKKYILEPALTADIAIVNALKADEAGNLIFDKSARNTNPIVAMAGDWTIAEVEEIVPVGRLHPEEIVTPGVFVNQIVQSKKGVNWTWAWETSI